MKINNLQLSRKRIFSIIIYHLLVFVGVWFLVQSCQTSPSNDENITESQTTMSFVTADNIVVYGDLFEVDKSNTTILLFHQAGANALSEYGSIIPHLIEMGYNVMAIDQRSGGQRFGGYNRTVAELPTSRFGYCDVYPDLIGSINYLKEHNYSGKKIVWGSSYSAALVIKLASDHPEEIAAVLAFSPASGEPMNDCKPEQYFGALPMPVLILRPQREADIESVKYQLELAKSQGHQTYVANPGTHGSSMLVKQRVGGDVSATWEVVADFLERISTND